MYRVSKKSYMSCSELKCNIGVCKKCFESYNENKTSYIPEERVPFEDIESENNFGINDDMVGVFPTDSESDENLCETFSHKSDNSEYDVIGNKNDSIHVEDDVYYSANGKMKSHLKMKYVTQ